MRNQDDNPNVTLEMFQNQFQVPTFYDNKKKLKLRLIKHLHKFNELDAEFLKFSDCWGLIVINNGLEVKIRNRKNAPKRRGKRNETKRGRK